MPASEIEFDERKFDELVLYVSERLRDDRSFGRVKLNKVLFFSDFYSFTASGRAITGATYIRKPLGPVAKQVMHRQYVLEKDGSVREEKRPGFSLAQKKLVPLRKPNLDLFTSDEIALIDNVIEELRPLNAAEVADLSHQLCVGWHLVAEGEEIPYYSGYLSGDPPTEADIEWARELAGASGGRPA